MGHGDRFLVPPIFSKMLGAYGILLMQKKEAIDKLNQVQQMRK
ncbi:hypothetical protein [Lentibacillus sp. Marseille-P4043]|nr:hypothetical protein [Lentibacillus sp. Marseille-P4043]